MTDNDQPRPDLDAAIDAVLPSLTHVADGSAVASLRRTRVALADVPAPEAGVDAWRWRLAAAAAAVAAIVAAAWLAPGATRTTRPDRMVEAVGASAPLVARTILPTTATSAAPAPESMRIPAARPAGGAAVSAHTASLPESGTPARRPDPLLTLMAAVQAIPDDAWARGVDLAQRPVPLPHVPLEPIPLAPLETPPIIDAPAESTAPGEP